ncbi:MAG: GNAT family N-acetyltransferase [Pseudomonadota bacterium]
MHSIRPAQPNDAERLSQIARSAYAPYVADIGREPPRMLQDFPADIAAGRCWVSGRPALGYVVAYPREDDWMLENVAVAPEAQGTGLGRTLIVHAEDLARAAGAPAIVLYTHAKMTRNRVLYPALGYRQTKRETQHGLDRVFFQKDLQTLR